ncbi:MAG: M56 family metallopeptidase [Acetatifactor sp.]|nr:M56 family metallopeptidase [Acetatifactor sp.]
MLLIQVLNMSLTASYCILAVLVARWLLRRAPKKYAYLLWLVVAFRLCCPVSFNSPLSLFNLGIFDQEVAEGHTMAYLDEDVGLQQNPQLATGLAVSPWQNTVGGQESGTVASHGKPENDIADQSLYIPLPGPGNEANSINPVQVWGAVGMLLWLSGMAIMLLCGLGSYLVLRYRLRCSVLLRDNIYQSEQVISPFILGFWHPHIYIPFGLEEHTLELVLAHERYHLRRRDHWVKLAAYLLLVLHWFNPLCWVAFRLMGRDMEMSCDEHVLAERQHSCKPYCNALLAFATGRRSWSPSPLAFGESGAKGRIHNALKWKKPGTWVKVAAVVLCMATVITCALNPQAESSQPGQDETNYGLEPGGNQGTVIPEDSYATVANPDIEKEENQGSDMPELPEGSSQEGIMVIPGTPGQDTITDGAEWILLRTSCGWESGATWDADALKNAREGLALLEMANLDFYGVEDMQLEVSWECEQLSVHVEYYEENGSEAVRTEQRDMVLPRENGCFPIYLENPYAKLQGNGLDVRISFSHDGAEHLIRGFIPSQGREQLELDTSEPGTVMHFQGLIRNITDDSIVIDQKKLISSGDPEWEAWAAQWDPYDVSGGLALLDLAYEDLHAMVSEDCRITILENHWYPEKEIGWEELLQYIEEDSWCGLWNFTVEGNRITEIGEQYLP